MIAQRARAGAVLIFVFATGVLSGMFFERHHRVARPAPVAVAADHEATLLQLREALRLDDHQVEQIRTVLADNQEMVQKMWEQLRPEVQNAMRQVHSEIAELLRPDQVELFHTWMTQQLERDPGLQH